MSNLSDIVNVQISVSTPVSDNESFGVVLIVGPGPAIFSENGPPDVGIYTSLSEVKEAGWATDEPIYLAASVAFAQSPSPEKIFIAIQKKVSAEKESIAETLNRAIAYQGWYGIAPAGITEEEYDEIALWAEANEKLFGFTTMDIQSPLSSTTYMRTLGIYAKTGLATPETNKYAHVAWLATGFSYAPGQETWALKTLGVVQPSVLTSAEMMELKSKNLNYYVEYAGRNVTQNGKTIGGEWIDIIRFRDWLKNDMQLRIFNLFVTNPKVPFTNGGIATIENQMLASLKQGQSNGGIAGEEYDVDGKTVPGYTVSVPMSAAVSEADKAARVLRGCKFTARLAGAIHVTNVSGTLVY